MSHSLSCWSLPESAWLYLLLHLDAEGTQECLALALHIQGTHFLRTVMTNEKGIAGERR